MDILRNFFVYYQCKFEVLFKRNSNVSVKSLTNRFSTLKGALAILKIKKQGKRRGNDITHCDKCTSSPFTQS